MKSQYSISYAAALLLGMVLPLFVSAKTPLLPSPQASFDYPQSLSLRADPMVSGSAKNLRAPLILSLSRNLHNVSTGVFSAEVAVVQNRWLMRVYPPVGNGLYEAKLSSGGVVLATSTLTVGLRTLPRIELDALPPYDVADGKLLRFVIRTNGGTMGVTQFSFAFATSSADVSQVALFGYIDPNYSQPIGSSTGPLADPIDPSEPVLTVQPYVPVEIPADSSYYFELDGAVTPSDGAYSVETTLLADPVSDPIADEPTVASTSNFVWSPNTYGVSATTTTDWVNGLAALMPYNLVEVRHGAPVVQGADCTITSSTSTVAVGKPFTLTWSTTAATSSKWDDGTVAALSGSRAITQGITATHTYILNVWGATGAGDCFATVVVPTVITLATTTASSTPAQATLTATPTSGAVTLSVKFTGSVNLTGSCNALTYTLFYGDGGSSQIAVSKNYCKSQTFSFTHSYGKVGTFNATLYLGTSTTTGQLLQSQTITVNSKTAFMGVINAASAVLAVPGNIISWLVRLVEDLYAAFRDKIVHGAFAAIPPELKSASAIEQYLQNLTEEVPAPGALKIPIFIYHSVHADLSAETALQRKYNTTPQLLEQQLVYLQNKGYTAITLDQVYAGMKAGTTSPVAKPVVLTFDDGWESQYLNAFPLLKKYHMTATFYVYTNPIGRKFFLTWNEIKEMDAAGMTIAGHTLSHPYLRTLTPSRLKKEVTESKKIIEERLGKTVLHFASPFGYTSPDIIATLKDAGYQTARTTYRGIYQDNPLRLRGFLVSDTFDDFVSELNQ